MLYDASKAHEHQKGIATTKFCWFWQNIAGKLKHYEEPSYITQPLLDNHFLPDDVVT